MATSANCSVMMGVLVLPLVETQQFRPCQIYRDIRFSNTMRGLRCLMFENYYTAFITIKQGIEDDKGAVHWTTVLDRKRLMSDPHLESDAQDWHVIGTDTFSNNFKPDSHFLRIYMMQPSPNWLNIDVKSVSFYSDEPNKVTGPATADRFDRSNSSLEHRKLQPKSQSIVCELDGLARDFGDNVLKFRMAKVQQQPDPESRQIGEQP